MSQLRRVWCTNCGTDWTVENQVDHNVTPAESICPVCYLPMSINDVPSSRVLSIGELEEQLGQLIASARASGLDAEVIVQALRGELQFAAEMDHAGHHFNVQLIDLGLIESEMHHRPIRDRREILQTRSVNE